MLLHLHLHLHLHACMPAVLRRNNTLCAQLLTRGRRANVEAASLPFAIANLILHYMQLAIFLSCTGESENNVKEVIGEHVFNNVP